MRFIRFHIGDDDARSAQAAVNMFMRGQDMAEVTTENSRPPYRDLAVPSEEKTRKLDKGQFCAEILLHKRHL